MRRTRGLGRKKYAAAVTAVMILAGLLAGCGSEEPQHSARVELGAAMPIEGDSSAAGKSAELAVAADLQPADGEASQVAKVVVAGDSPAEGDDGDAKETAGSGDAPEPASSEGVELAAKAEATTPPAKQPAVTTPPAKQPEAVKPAALDIPTEPSVKFAGKKGAKLVALTFDDGPDDHFTPAILDILKEKKVHATFFTVGIQVKRHAKVMKRILQEGSEIGNHSYAHKDLSKLDSLKIVEQIKWTDININKQIGYVPRLVRAPYGAVSPLLKDIVKQNRRELVGWTVDTRDWEGSTVAEMRANVSKNTHAGGIILMHSFGNKYVNNTVQLLPQIIEDLKSKGFTFVTVSELLAAKKK
ncbi:polysaccharide deacetylase family protein [Paenibacillus silvisoli]|uniref:polysaccharide deacetylase family protein n=1 Tax=Paenibacillus silvisoli TaxID=3110539 RepID=UPI002805DE4B|nr:polysaccharide deacetylase family protein [Paenibacillus silvisoli]